MKKSKRKFNYNYLTIHIEFTDESFYHDPDDRMQYTRSLVHQILLKQMAGFEEDNCICDGDLTIKRVGFRSNLWYLPNVDLTPPKEIVTNLF